MSYHIFPQTTVVAGCAILTRTKMLFTVCSSCTVRKFPPDRIGSERVCAQNLGFSQSRIKGSNNRITVTAAGAINEASTVQK